MLGIKFTFSEVRSLKARQVKAGAIGKIQECRQGTERFSHQRGQTIMCSFGMWNPVSFLSPPAPYQKEKVNMLCSTEGLLHVNWKERHVFSLAVNK